MFRRANVCENVVRRRVGRRPARLLVGLLGLRAGPDHRQRRDHLDQGRIVVIEPERPLLPVGHAGRQVHDLVDRGVLLDQAALGEERVESQQEEDRQNGSGRRSDSRSRQFAACPKAVADVRSGCRITSAQRDLPRLLARGQERIFAPPGTLPHCAELDITTREAHCILTVIGHHPNRKPTADHGFDSVRSHAGASRPFITA